MISFYYNNQHQEKRFGGSKKGIRFSKKFFETHRKPHGYWVPVISVTKDKIPISPSGGRYFYCQRRGIYHVHAPREAAQPAAKEHAPACSFRFLPPPLPPFVSTSSTPQHSCDNPLSKPRNLLMTLLYHKKLVMSSQKSQVSCDYPLTKPKIQRSILSKAVCICRGGARRVFW